MSRLMRAVLLLVMLVGFSPLVAQASGGYEFEPVSSSCDNTPANVQLGERTRNDRYKVTLSFEITQEQVDAAVDCGSHFNAGITFLGFDSMNDWKRSCTIDSSTSSFIGSDVVVNDDGTATAWVYGVNLVRGRLYPGDTFTMTVDCRDLWPDDSSSQRISAKLVRTWWSSIDIGKPGCEDTDFTTKAGQPVCVYTGSTAQLVDADWNEEFPFDN